MEWLHLFLVFLIYAKVCLLSYHGLKYLGSKEANPRRVKPEPLTEQHSPKSK